MPGSFILVLALSGRSIGIPAQAVAEIVLLPRLIRPPGLPSCVEGMMNRHGHPVPVVRLDRLFGLPDMVMGVFSVVVVLRRPGAWDWAVLAEQAVEVIHDAAPAPAPADLAFNGCVAFMAAASVGLVPVVAPDRLLRRQEESALADFAEQAVRRLDEWSGGTV